MISDNKDCLTAMICDHQRLAAELNPCDADARAAWLTTAALLLSAVHDPFERLSHAMSLAIVLVVRCPDLPSSVALKSLRKGW